MNNDSIHLVISGIDVSPYVVDYDVSGSRRSRSSRKSVSGGSSGDSFVNWDGTVIGADGTVYDDPESYSYVHVTSLSASLARVPRGLAASIGAALNSSEGISVSYDSPARNTSGAAVLVSYKASSRRFGETWDFDFSLEIEPPEEDDDPASGGGL